MPAKRRVGRPRKPGRKQRGAGFLDWVRGAVNTVGNAARTVGRAVNSGVRSGVQYARNNLKPSTILNLASKVPLPGAAALAAPAAIASAAGYSRRRRPRKIRAIAPTALSAMHLRPRRLAARRPRRQIGGSAIIAF